MELTQPLLPEQVELLKLVWSPIPQADMWVSMPDWPLWDYVARELHRQFPELTDAADVLLSLPSLPTRVLGGPYGLVWRGQHPAITPAPAERIGLTIAGLAALAAHQGVSSAVPDALACVIGQLASWDNGLPAKPHEVVSADVPLANFTGWFAKPVAERPYVFPDRAIASLLWREYAPVSVQPIDADSDHEVHLGPVSLRRYRGVTTADEYLARIAERQAAQLSPEYSSPLTLVQTFDYLAYVLAADSLWSCHDRLTSAPDLQAAAAVSSVVTNRHEFETALSGLCTVIDQLVVPDIPQAVLDECYRGERPATVNRFAQWLALRLVDSDGLSRVNGAVDVIRAVRRLRVEVQHSSPSTRQRAIEARRLLGLSDVVSDWSGAWQTIQQRLAGALDVIRQEVQAAPPPAT
ncbi:MAG: hypothetical protein ACYDB7_00990 [Mycobacteriales bacterium]